MPLARIYKVTIDHLTTRFWDATLPEIPVLKAAFPGLGAEKFKVQPTALVQDFDTTELWGRVLKTWPKYATAAYGGGGDVDTPPPGFITATIAMENEANLFLAEKDRAVAANEAWQKKNAPKPVAVAT